MSRVIKFRAWDGVGMHDWDWFKLQRHATDWLDQNATENWHVMQFTGLLDKNGVEIYEGDYIELDPNLHPFYLDVTIIGEVFWNRYEAEWEHTYCDGRPPKKMFKGCKVIGNIYLNPDPLD
ncbi:YopX family protein [Rhodococcus erythropolis]